MPKPIVVIYFPENFESSGRRSWVYDYMRYLNGERTNGDITYGETTDYWKDYYWFCFLKEGIAEPELQVFYEKDFTEIQFMELKELINNSIKKIQKDANY